MPDVTAAAIAPKTRPSGSAAVAAERWEDEAAEPSGNAAVTVGRAGTTVRSPRTWPDCRRPVRRRTDLRGRRRRHRSRRPDPGRADRRPDPPCCAPTAGSWPTPTCMTALALECSRCLRDIDLPGRRPLRGGVPAGHRPHDRPPAADRRRARRRPPDRPPRARSRDARPRGDPAGRADRAARPARLPGPLHRLRPAARRGRPRPSRRRHRPATRGAPRLPRRRWLTAAVVDRVGALAFARSDQPLAAVDRPAARGHRRADPVVCSWVLRPSGSPVDRSSTSTRTSSSTSGATSSIPGCRCVPTPSPGPRLCSSITPRSTSISSRS